MTPGQRALLKSLAARKSPALAIQISQTRRLAHLRELGYVFLDDHPETIDASTGGPALAVFVSEMGRRALNPAGKDG